MEAHILLPLLKSTEEIDLSIKITATDIGLDKYSQNVVSSY
jgi:hypothetical protein